MVRGSGYQRVTNDPTRQVGRPHWQKTHPERCLPDPAARKKYSARAKKARGRFGAGRRRSILLDVALQESCRKKKCRREQF
jgi:hypothetical protein